MHWWWWLFPEHHRRRHRHHHHGMQFFVLLTVDDVGVMLKPNEEIILMTDITLGQGLDLSLAFLDQNGQPMTVTPVPDAAPIWSNSTPATETLTVSADGFTAQTASVAAGTDTITASATVGGATFSATLVVNVAAPPQVLTSIAINAAVR